VDISWNAFDPNLGTQVTVATDAPGTDMNQAPEQVADPSQGAPQFSRPSSEPWTPELRQLVDSSYQEANQWALTKHDGGQFPPDAVQRYRGLQDSITTALRDPNTPRELIAPLSAAGYNLFSAANQSGLTGVTLPPEALNLLSGSARPRKP